MVDPDNAASARGMTGELGEDPANAGGRAVLCAPVPQTARDDKAAPDDIEPDYHETPRRAPTMWR